MSDKNGSTNWKRTTLGEVAEVIRGVTYKKHQAATENGPGLIPLLRSGNVQQHVTLDNLVYVPAEIVKPQQFLRPNDIVVSTSNSRALVGKAAQLDSAWYGTFGAFCTVVRPRPLIQAGFLALFMQSPEYRRAISELSAATNNIANVKNSALQALEVPVAPRGEQDEIVALLERLLETVAAGEASITRSEHQLDTYLRTVMGRAFFGMAPRRPLSDVAALSSGATPSRGRPEYFGGTLPWVKIGDLTEGPVLKTEETITEEAHNASSTNLLPPGTVLLAMYGASIGRTGILEISATTNQAICAMQPKPDVLDRDFLFHYLRFSKPLFVKAGYGGAQPNISQRFLKQFEIPVPPLSDQGEAVALIERQRAEVDRTASTLVHSRRAAARLRASLLSRAFAGGLTNSAALARRKTAMSL